MTVEHVELLVEEPSMEAALRLLLPKMLGDLSFDIFPHQCKDELLLRLAQRLHGYARRRKIDVWFRDHCRIVVVIDRDDDDCVMLKRRMEKMVTGAGLTMRSGTVAEGQHTRRPDMALYVNGLPLMLVELKNAPDENATIWSTYQQFETYEAGWPSYSGAPTSITLSVCPS